MLKGQMQVNICYTSLDVNLLGYLIIVLETIFGLLISSVRRVALSWYSCLFCMSCLL